MSLLLLQILVFSDVTVDVYAVAVNAMQLLLLLPLLLLLLGHLGSNIRSFL